MNRLNTHYKQIISYDLINKFNYTNSFQLSSIKNITVNLSSIKVALERKKIIQLLLAIELITGQKGKITTSKKNKIHLKIKQGVIVGCKVNLNKKNSYIFLDNLITLILPHIKDFQGFTFNKNSFQILSFKLNNSLHFFELQNEFLNFSDIPSLDISINLNSNNIKESSILLNSFNFPIKK